MNVQKYKPRKDIPFAVRELKTFSPSRIRDWIREHKTKKDKTNGKRFQLNVTPQSISMWFKRHPDVLRRLKIEVKEEELSKETISETIFENGFFYELESVKHWTLKIGGKAKAESVKKFGSIIKKVCQGILRCGRKNCPPVMIEGWGLKHPDNLTTRDALEYIGELKKRGYPTRNTRLALRNFLKANNRSDWDDISGETEDAGKYAHLYITRDKITEILEYLEQRNKEAHDAVAFGFKTACRITATLTAHAKDYRENKLENGKIERTIWVWEKAVLHKGKRHQEKCIPEDLYEVLKTRIDRGGKLFDIKPNELNALLRSTYKKIIPELAEDIPRPFHFWRHQFAQHLLRETNWNYGLVARLGHWTVETLERYYGKMDRKTALESGRKHLPNI